MRNKTTACGGNRTKRRMPAPKPDFILMQLQVKVTLLAIVVNVVCAHALALFCPLMIPPVLVCARVHA